MEEEKTITWITGFWRRIGAFAIDSFLIGILGFGLGTALEEFFIEIGIWGRFVGFAIALGYFGVMNSSITNGQTFGKRLLKIRVVNAENKPINLTTSLGRYSVLGIPFFLNGAPFSMDILMSFWGYLLSMAIFGGLISIAYLYIFNRITRQSLHDVIFNTFVVNVNAEKQELGAIWKPHLIVVGILFVVAALVPVFSTNFAQQEPFPDILKTQSAINADPAVSYVGITYSYNILTTEKAGTSKSTFVNAIVYVNAKDKLNEEFARSIAERIVENYSGLKTTDKIGVSLVYGFNIGIASKWQTLYFQYDPTNLGSKGLFPD